jgi:hypothetical protein
VFLASSVVKSLKENKTLTIYGLDMVTCPVDSCFTKPGECSKGQTESFVKKIDVVYEHGGHNKVVVLVFRYQLKHYEREGFIKAEDLALNFLIKREIVNRKYLIENEHG